MHTHQLFSNEIHWIDLLIDIFIWPMALLGLRWLYFLWRYWLILGEYVGGKSIVSIQLRFLCVFRVTCIEGGGQTWEGRSYKINDEGNSLSGLFVWNPRQITIADIGEHHIFFSVDRKTAFVKWKKLTELTDPIEGIAEWKKIEN